jgi:CRISPR/Cas system CMR subunit Cmr6 (Cas7 group RAMP superfamily)
MKINETKWESAGAVLAFVVTDRKGRIRFVTAYPMDRQQREIYRGEEE